MESEGLTGLLELDALASSDAFISRQHRRNFQDAIYGGQVLAQALVSAAKTSPDRPIHSLHAYFLKAGKADQPIEYHVERVRDGGHFSNRRVKALQNDEEIFSFNASFHTGEQGLEHQDLFPGDVPQPEQLLKHYQASQTIPEHGSHNDASNPFQLLPVPKHVFTSTERLSPDACFWLKANEALADNGIIQQAALAFASDLGLLATAVLPHPTSMFADHMFVASVDHSMWFHHSKINLNEWVLCKTHSPWAASGRGFARASIFNRDGLLLATTAQEGLLRLRSN